MDIKKIQDLLAHYELDGWLFSDYHGHDFITRDFLGLKDRFCTRRLFYFIPKEGEPIKVLSAIEPLLLDHLPGEKRLYKGLAGMNVELSKILKQGLKIACQYSKGGDVPTACSVDGGTVDLISGYGVELVCSCDLLQYFGATLTPAQIESHKKAGKIIEGILQESFKWIRESLDSGLYIDEWALLQKLQELINKTLLYMDTPPFLGWMTTPAIPGMSLQMKVAIR